MHEEAIAVSPVIDPAELLNIARHEGPIWHQNSEQMNVNLIRFSAGQGVAQHINQRFDVFGVVVAGEGVLAIEDETYQLRAGQAFLIPRGVRRSLRSTSSTFAYISCHQRRGGLMPELYEDTVGLR